MGTAAMLLAVAGMALLLPVVRGAAPQTSSDGVNKCYSVFSRMDVNPLQVYPGNPDSQVFGFTQCTLCTNGTMHCTSLTHSGKSELIAAHIHMVNPEETDGKDGQTGEGPPVINFCGKSGTGFIADGTEYMLPCRQWDKNGVAHNDDMPGVLVKNFNRGITVAERVEDIAKQPHMYYFNFHSLASWTRWYPTPHGICRGKLEVQGVIEDEGAAPTTQTSTTTVTTTTTSTSTPTKPKLRGSKKCYDFYSRMNVNPLQAYPGSPDSKAFGFAQCELCTDGAMHCTALTHSGKSELIAAHIHMVPPGDGKDGQTGEGPPVINFCGKSGTGFIADGTDYPEACGQWDKNGAAHNRDMVGVLVKNFNRGVSVAERVEDIAKQPHMYYFNFHSLASWTRWYPTPHGICRGELVLKGSRSL